ncbi:unnamed protein product, partial [Allacma fusca]
ELELEDDSVEEGLEEEPGSSRFSQWYLSQHGNCPGGL